MLKDDKLQFEELNNPLNDAKKPRHFFWMRSLHFILIFIRSIDNINRSIAAAGGVENCMRRIL